MQVPFKVSPPSINFGTIARKEPTAPKKVVITRGDGGPLNLKLEPVEMQNIAAQVKEIEPGARYELEVTLTPPFEFKRDRLRTKLTLATGIADAPTATVSVSANVRPRVAAKPTRFSVPKERKSDWEQSVELVWDDGSSHRILEAAINDPALSVRVEEEDGKHRVVLSVPQDFTTKSRSAMVTIRTDDVEAQQVTVPVRFAQSRPRKRPKTARTTAPHTEEKQRPDKTGPTAPTGADAAKKQQTDKTEATPTASD